MCSPPVNRSRIRITVVSAVTTSSTNITGFLISVRGLSLTKAEPMAGTTIFGSNSADTGMLLRKVEVSIDVSPGLAFLFEHDLFRKPVTTFRDHAQLDENSVPAFIASCSTIG